MNALDKHKNAEISRVVQELRIALNQVSPGPWRSVDFDDEKYMSATAVVGAAGPEIGRPEADQVIAMTLLQTPPIAACIDSVEENTEFICTARNKVPILLDLLEELGF